MALIACPECTREVSDAAESCPHCGHPIKATVVETPPAQSAKTDRNSPIFLALSLVALVLAFGTPRLLIFFPVAAIIGFALVSLLRREHGSAFSLLLLFAGFGVWMLSGLDISSISTTTKSNLETAEIVSWNWRKEPNFGTRGTIKWSVEVKNKSSEPVATVKVDFSTYDAGEKLVSSTFTYVSAIPPGQSRTAESYADLYHTEKTARIQISQVRFSR